MKLDGEDAFSWSDRLPLLLVADTSDSAVPFWPRIAKTIGTILETLPEDAPRRVCLLGHDVPVDIELLLTGEPALLPPHHVRHSSLIAPVMDSLLRQSCTLEALIIVGNGQVWDLADWLDCPLVHQWLLVQVGPDSLQIGDLGIPEYPAEQVEAALSRLWSEGVIPPRARPDISSFWSSTKYTWEVDRAGFPLIYIEPLGMFVHLFPVAKAQFERFLCQCNSPKWGDRHYAELLGCNPRVSPRELQTSAHECMFLTGILPQEANEFARWLGRGYGLLQIDEWRAAARWLGGQDATPMLPELAGRGLSHIAADLWQALWAEIKPASLLELSLMEGGVVEWVLGSCVGGSGQHIGMGHPHSSFFPSLKTPDAPLVPIDAGRRMRHFGFRLRRRP
jgi:hypothetical protein